MEIIVENHVALPCAKSPVSRTSGAIYVVTRVENVLARTPWKETRKESEWAGVETTKGWKVQRERERDGKRVGTGWKVGRDSDVGLTRVAAVGLGTGQDKSSHAGGADGAVVQGHGISLPGTEWTWHCDIRGAHWDNCEVQ